MDFVLNQLRRVIDRIIMPLHPEIESYTFDVRQKNDWTYVAVVYVPHDIKMYNDWENEEVDKWIDIVTQTRRYYDATGHDEHYLLAAIGEMKEFMAPPPPGAENPIKWWWRLDSQEDWRQKRNRNAQFYMNRGLGIG